MSEPNAAAFARNRALLERYLAAHAGVWPSVRCVYEGHQLGVWLNNQRQEHRRGTLAADRVAALEALGIAWTPMGSAFPTHLAHLERYLAAHDGGWPPFACVDDGVPLGEWLARQRAAYRHGTLAADRVAALEALGIVWTPREQAFPTHRALLERYLEEHDGVWPAWNCVFEGKRLGSWVNTQRTAYNQGELAADRVAALEALGIAWEPRDAVFAENLACLKVYLVEHDDVWPTARRVVEGKHLGVWVAYQRRAYRHGTLAPDRVAALEALGIAWDPREQQFTEHLVLLEGYLAAHGGGWPPYDCVVGGRWLGVWLHTQRVRRKRGQLAADRVAALEALGIDWTLRATRPAGA